MGLTRHKFNANCVCAMWTIKGWHVTIESVNICLQILCILLRNPMTLQFDNVGHNMDWTMHFSTWKWLILTVAYLVLHHWRPFTHSARVGLKWSLMLSLTMYPKQKGSIGPHCAAFSQNSPAKISHFIPIHDLLQWDNQHFQDFCC